MSRGSRSNVGDRFEAPLARLSTPPERRWPDGALHHGSRVLLLLLLAVATTLFFPPDPGTEIGRHQVGTVAQEDVIASITFGVPKNPEELERERNAAAATVPPTFELHPGTAERMERVVASFFRQVAGTEEEENPGQALDRLLGDLGLVLTPQQRRALREGESREVIERAALRAIREILPQGVTDEGVPLSTAGLGRILVVEGDVDRYLPVDSVLTSRDFFQRAAALLPGGSPSEVDELLRLTLIRFLEPSLRYDAVATERDRDAARRAVPTTRATVLQGEAVVRAAQQIGESDLERLRAYEEALRAEGRLQRGGFRLLPTLGSILLNLLILSIFAGLLYLFRTEIYHNFRWVLLQGVLIGVFAGAGGLIARHGLPVELLPIAFVTLAVAVLWDGRLALVLAAVLTVLLGVQPPFQEVGAWLPLFMGGSAAALSVRAVRRRAQTWVFIAIIATAYFGALLTLGVIGGRDAGGILMSWGWAAGNTVVSAILAMGFLPVFEWFTRITTDQTLLEWADPNRPLLKRLSMEAPGTYAHTINVANLSEAAANAIGANGLLCRVGVYYHDVGKMLKPQYFIENQPSGRNPHDKLKAATSAAIVREHVTEGMRLAREAKLPDVLLDFIPEHHGTQDIAYFLDRARKEAGEEEIRPEDFRYPGPRPQSRETAVVMLADSVESATRTVQDPTPERIRELIDTIVKGKIEAGQLDEAPLTLREIGDIKAQFLKVLGGVYHHRIDYPQTRHITHGTGSGDGNEGGEGSEGGTPSARGRAEGAARTGAAKGAAPRTHLQLDLGGDGGEGPDTGEGEATPSAFTPPER